MKKVDSARIYIILDDDRLQRAYKTLNLAKEALPSFVNHNSKLSIKSVPIDGPWVVNDDKEIQ